MPITFLDGTMIELVYPTSANLSALPITLNGDAFWGTSGVGLTIVHGARSQVFAQLPSDRFYRDATGGAVPSYGSASNGYLGFEIGHWTVAAFMGSLPESDRALVARSLAGFERRSGFLVLTPYPPVRLGPIDGPDAMLGNAVELIRRPCGQFGGRRTTGGLTVESTQSDSVVLCDAQENLVASFNGSTQRIADQLQIR
jgi:hypothetical protein